MFLQITIEHIRFVTAMQEYGYILYLYINEVN